VEVTNADGSVVAARPGLRIFVDGHYSLLFESGTEPRPSLPDSTGTAAELTAALGPLTANAGTYELVGDTIVSRATVAKNPGVMAPDNFIKTTYRIAGDTIWLSQVANDAGPVRSPIRMWSSSCARRQARPAPWMAPGAGWKPSGEPSWFPISLDSGSS
jgi:hypothetical protein